MASVPQASGYKAGDVLVVVGELFGRGYANGLVDEARRLGCGYNSWSAGQ